MDLCAKASEKRSFSEFIALFCADTAWIFFLYLYVLDCRRPARALFLVVYIRHTHRPHCRHGSRNVSVGCDGLVYAERAYCTRYALEVVFARVCMRFSSLTPPPPPFTFPATNATLHHFCENRRPWNKALAKNGSTMGRTSHNVTRKPKMNMYTWKGCRHHVGLDFNRTRMHTRGCNRGKSSLKNFIVIFAVPRTWI